ncbi:MAG: carbamate kinase [Promethearchaeota archaeon]|nr:MAG: carbamate kinase [Candidatus Lokiarchaeota archaeon]
MKTIIVALGGNALIKPGDEGTIEEMMENLKAPIKQIAELSKNYNLVISHGNGPQVGLLLLQQEATEFVRKRPLQILVAETQGQIGFMIESTLDEELMKIGLDEEKLFLTILTYVKVDANDPAFKNPTKPIGPAYPVRTQPGQVKTAKGWRRVVPSPKPIKIYQWREIKKLMELGSWIVIACGGGGIPVIKEEKKLYGVEAVIDKDLASSKLAEQIGADILLIATDVEKVALNYGTPEQEDLEKLSVSEAKQYLEEGQFPVGSMGPKIQAIINFLEAGGEKAIITSIEKIKESLEGKAGTYIYMDN